MLFWRDEFYGILAFIVVLPIFGGILDLSWTIYCVYEDCYLDVFLFVTELSF